MSRSLPLPLFAILTESLLLILISLGFMPALEYFVSLPVLQNNIQIRFDKSVRFRLIEEYGLNCYEENENGLLLSLDYTNKGYIFG